MISLSDSHVLLIANSRAGRGDGAAAVAAIRARLAPQVARFDLRVLERGEDAGAVARAAVAQGAGIVAVLGGDGTQSAVAGALAGTRAVMAPLPGGTFNFFARDLGLGETVEAALDALEAGHVAMVPLACVNDRVFVNNTSFGAYPDILDRRESLYRRWGRSRLGAYWAVITALVQMRRPLVLQTTDAGQSRHYRTALAFVARNATQLGMLGLTEGTEAVRRGQLALFIARASRPGALIGAAIRLAFGMTTRHADFDLICTDCVTITTRPQTRLIARDGERERMAGPFRLTRHPAMLRVIARPQEDRP